MTDALYDKQKAKWMEALPIEDKTEDIGLDLDEEAYEGLHYDKYPVVDMGWWFNSFYLYYDSEPDGPEDEFDIETFDTWRYNDLRWRCRAANDGTLVVNTDTCVGCLNHIEARECDVPHAESLEPVYKAMHDAGLVLVAWGDGR